MFYLLRSRWPLIVLVASLVLLGGAVVKRKSSRLFEASARLVFEAPASVPETSASGFRPAQANDLARQAAELGSRALLQELVAPGDLAARWRCADEIEALRLLEARIRVEVVPADRALVVAARDLSREHAAALANALADRFIARKESEARAEANARVRKLTDEIDESHREVAEFEARLVALAKLEGGDPGTSDELRRHLVSERNLIHSLEAKHQLAVLEADEARGAARLSQPALPDRSRPVARFWLSLPVLLFLGLLGGAGAAFAGVRGKTRWDAIAEAMARLEAPLAGFAPLHGGSSVASAALPETIVEAYREIRNRLLRLPAGDCLMLALMPQRGGDPSAEATVNLACVLADAGRTVLVIDADFRRPRLHSYFDAAQHPGLSDFLSGEMRLEETVVRSRRANLWFMPAGPLPEDPGGLLNGRRMGDLVWDLRSRFEFILVTSPSIHEVSDAGLLASLADYCVVLTPYLGHSLRRLRETKLALETVSASLAGVFFTTGAELPPPPARPTSGPALAGRP